MDAKAGRGAYGLPFLATMFHAVGLNVIDARERKREVLDVSTRTLRDMIAMSWLRTTEPLHSCTAENFTYIVSVVDTLTCTSWYPVSYSSLHSHLEWLRQSPLEYEKQVMMVRNAKRDK